MRIFVDENIPTMTVRALRDRGHDVRDLRGTSHEGMRDEMLWGQVQSEGRRSCPLASTRCPKMAILPSAVYSQRQSIPPLP